MSAAAHHARAVDTTALVARLLPFGVDPHLEAAWRRRRNVSVVEVAALAQVLPALDLATATHESFTHAHETLRALPSSSVTAVLASPHAFAWLRRCFECVDVLAGRAAAESVAHRFLPGQTIRDFAHEVFDRAAVFAVAASMHAGRSATLPVPLRILRPASLPGTPWHVAPLSDVARLRGAEHRPIVEGCAVIALRHRSVQGRALFIDPLDAWLATDAGAGEDLARDGAALDALDARLAEALALLEMHAPRFLDEVSTAYRVVAPSVPRAAGGFPSGTTSSSLGFSVFATPPMAAVLGEMLVHEASHAHLFIVQDIDPLLSPKHHGSGWEQEVLYSPWRDDPRPLNGILHAAFVFARASRLWLLLHEKGSNGDRDLARRRLAVLRLQLAMARASLHRHARWTAAGEVFFAEVDREIGVILVETGRLGLEAVTPLYAEAASTNIARGAARARQHAHFMAWRARNPELDRGADDDASQWLDSP